MKIVLIILLFALVCTRGTSQTVGLSMSDVKAPPQYISAFLLKKSVQKTDNQKVETHSPRPIPLVFSVETLPFFCKIEHKMGLNQKLPVKFRLGDVQYVDELEGKRKTN